ncbi:hypothetical protein VTL71DRAFT_1758 [Oculimacula yallundae]|uniref:Uncharacterized protein n=1 Tax=Oculimacula yallundae TaxID=86028 RepID=A0ABR4CBK9_9HELO
MSDTEKLGPLSEIPMKMANIYPTAFRISKSRQDDDNFETKTQEECQMAAQPARHCPTLAHLQDHDERNGASYETLLTYFQVVQYAIRLTTIVSGFVLLYMILGSLNEYLSAKTTPDHPLDTIPGSGAITTGSLTHAIVLVGTNVMLNCILGGIFCVMSIEIHKHCKTRRTVMTGYLLGLATALGVCIVLRNRISPPSDVWSWSCSTYKSGITNDAMNFERTCHTMNKTWRLCIVHVFLEALSLGLELARVVLLKAGRL